MNWLFYLQRNIVMIVFALAKIIAFVTINKAPLIGMLIGTIAAYFYWLEIGIYYGSYPMSSECWVNCVYGGLFGGFIGCLHAD